jgi:large subunit ribosomal protein L22
MKPATQPRRDPETGKNRRRVASNEARAVLRTLRISPQKLNLVAQSIRGLSAEKAVNELRFSQKRISKDVLKCLKSAIDNAENNHSLDVDSLVVAQAHVGKNITMKRMHTRARGRGVRIEKLFSQITIVLRDTSKQPETAEAA